MTLFAQSGQKAAALRQYEICKQSLKTELDIEPSPKTIRMYEQIRDRPIKPTASLPNQTTPFVGREKQLDELAKLLAKPDVRLVTILAPGGMGKTRLALEAGIAQFDHFANGVYFIPFAPIESIDSILSTIAETVNFHFYSGANPQQQLVDYFREKQALLLMDNFEHLLAGSGLIIEILRAAPGVKVLVTSRSRLNLHIETVYVLGGMEYPTAMSPELIMYPQDVPQTADQSAYDAISLFVGGAQRARPEFEPHAGNLESITRICELVGGMPLGIELAAAWAGMLSIEEIAAEIQGGLDFLTIEMQDVSKRHHSIRTVLDRAWDILDESNQELFKKMTVFRGCFTRDAAQQVAGATLRQLLTLANQSFIRRNPTGWYQIHELLRKFGEEKLDENLAEKQRVRDSHCEYYAAFLQQREAELFAGDQQEALLEIDNIRAAWRLAVKKCNFTAIRKASFGLLSIFELQSWFPEALQAFESAADALHQEDPVGERGIAYGQILWILGLMKDRSGQHQIATQLIRLSPVILRRLGAHLELAFANIMLTIWRPPDLDVLPILQESLAIYKEMDIPWGIAFCLENLGEVYSDKGCFEEAEYHFQESLKLSQRIKNNRCIASAYQGLGDMCFNQGAYSQARQNYEASLTLFQRMGYKLLTGALHTSLGWVATILGEYEAAKEHHQEALALHKNSGFQHRIVLSIAYLGDVFSAMGRYGEARECYQEALDISQRADFQPDIPDIGILLGKFGNLAVTMGNYQEAQKRYLAALQVGLDFMSVELS